MAERPTKIMSDSEITKAIKGFGGPVQSLTTEELELELEILKSAISIFEDAQLPRDLWGDTAGTYLERVRALENEIFERGVLV